MSDLRERAEAVRIRIDRWEVEDNTALTEARHFELVALAEIVADLATAIEVLFGARP